MHNRHDSLNRLAVSATLHCLTGCSIGEVLGMVLGSCMESRQLEHGIALDRPCICAGYLLTMFRCCALV